MKNIVIAGIVLLLILHQDFWWWDDAEPLILGFIPIGLAYHAGISVAAAFMWWLATTYCWPTNVELEVEEALAENNASEGAA